MDEIMEKKMNLMSMLFLFLCVVGFDHFYRGVMKNNNTIQQTKNFSFNNKEKASPYYSSALDSKYNQRVAKLK